MTDDELVKEFRAEARAEDHRDNGDWDGDYTRRAERNYEAWLFGDAA